MKKVAVLFLLVFSFVIIGCDSNKYEIKTKIDPKYTIEANKDENKVIGLEYKLGPLLILDEVEITPMQFRYITNHPDLDLEVCVIYGDFSNSENGFYYYLKGIRFGEDETEPTELSDLMNYSDQIPGFVWFVKDNKEIKSVSNTSSDTSNSASGLRKLE